MSDELQEIWRDDRLIEAAARGDLHHTADAGDAAVRPLCALAQVADAGPLPRLDVEPEELVVTRGHHRYAVRSLAVAVAAVATLSTSGVSAVVTGDPFRPAKAFWQEIQDHTVARSDTVDGGLGSGSAVGAPEDAEPVARVQVQETTRDVGPVVSGAAGSNGQTAQAPSQAPPEEPQATTPAPEDTATGETEQPDDTAASPPAATAEDEAAAPEDSGTQEPTRDESQQESTQEQQDDEESSDAQQQPAPEEDSDGGLEPLVPRQPSEDQDMVQPDRSDTMESDLAQRAGSADDGAQQPLPSRPAPTTPPALAEATEGAIEGADDGVIDGAAAEDGQG